MTGGMAQAMILAGALASGLGADRLDEIDRRLAADRVALASAEAPLTGVLGAVQRLLLAPPSAWRNAALHRDAVLVRTLQGGSTHGTDALRREIARLTADRAELVVRDALRQRGMRPSRMPHVLPVARCAEGTFRMPVDSLALASPAALALGRPRGLTLVALPGESVAAPAAGRVAYAGGFRRYGGVVILDHGHGWTTLLTGLDRVTTRANVAVSAGDEMGRVRRTEPLVTVELSRHGRAVDPRAMLGRCPRPRAGARAFPAGAGTPT